MTEEKQLLVCVDDRVCTITINRPDKRNSLNTNILECLSQAMDDLDKSEDIRVIILRGKGNKAFCAGFDVSEIPTEPGNLKAGSEHETLEETFKRLRNFKYPVIAMINGACAGAGLDLALNCDLRIAQEGARLGITPAKLGVTYHPAGLNRFIQLVGVSVTKELFYTGRLIPATRALELGLVDQLVQADELEKVVINLAQEIADNAPLSIRCLKYTINKLTEKFHLTPEEEANVRAMHAKAFKSEDLAEGKLAFLQKRKPQFKGK